MKDSLFQLRGLTIRQWQLKEPFRFQGCDDDEIIYTAGEGFLCKVVDISKDISKLKYRYEKSMNEIVRGCKGVVECVHSQEIEFKKHPFGLFFWKGVTKSNSLRQQLQNVSSDRDVLAFLKETLMLLDGLHQRSVIFMNIRPEAFLRNTNRSFSACNFNKSLTKETTLEDIRQNCLLGDMLDLSHRYLSPQLLTHQPKQIVSFSTDIFNLGCLLYELCYKEYPFQTPLSVLNLQYKIPQKHGVCFPIVNQVIQKCLVQPKSRPKAFQLLKLLNARESQPAQYSSGSLKNSQYSTTIFDQFKNAITKITKQSQSWILSYTEDSDEEPSDRLCVLLLVKIYKNHDKLHKIYNLVHKHLMQRLNHPTSVLKFLLLLWNFVRKGPREVLGQHYQHTIREFIEIVARKYSDDPSITEILKMLKNKIEFIQQNQDVFQGNYRLPKLQNILKVDSKLMERMSSHLNGLISCYDRVQNMTFRSVHLFSFVLSNICDQLYDLTVTLIMLYVSINKDVEIGKRTEPAEKLSYIQLALQKSLRNISKFQKVPKLHVISSLQGGMMTYKYAIDFEDTQNIKITMFQLFYETNKIYNNLILPSSFVQQYGKNMKEDFSSGNTKLIKGKQNTFNEEDSDDEKPKASNRTTTVSKERKTSEDSGNVAIFQNWNQPKKEDKSFDVVFNEFKQKTVSKQSSTSSDFEVLWSTNQPEKKQLNFDFFQMNSDSSGQNNLNKKQSQTQPPKLIHGQSMEVIHKDVRPRQVSTALSQNQPKSQIHKPLNTLDLLDFDFGKEQPKSEIREQKKPQPFDFAFAFPEKKTAPPAQSTSVSGIPLFSIPQQPEKVLHMPQVPSVSISTPSNNSPSIGTINFDLISPNKRQPSSNKSPSLIALQNEICSDMKEPELQNLIRSSNIVTQFNKFQLLKVIGCGSTGQVYKGTFQNQTVAIKKIKVKEHKGNTFKEFERQLTTLIRIKKHQNLVSLIAISKKQDEYYLLIDYCEGGNLFQLLHRRTDVEVSWKARIRIAKQIAVAMNYLHNCQPQIIHRDLKSLNILIEKKFQSQDDGANIKVTDFGLSRNPDAEYMTSALGTLHWMAPELLENKNYTLKVDVYSYGVVLWQICCRQTPYKDFKSPLAIMKHVTLENGRPNMSKINVGCPIELKKLITRCWGTQTQRPNFSEIIQILQVIDLTY